MVTLRACEVLGGPRRGRFHRHSSKDEPPWSSPRSNPALTTLLPLLAGGHFSLLAPLGEIQFARRAHRAALTEWGGWGRLAQSSLLHTMGCVRAFAKL